MEQITLDALERALAPIEAIGKSEVIFNVQPSGKNTPGTVITLRIMLPEEEINAQRFAAEVLADSDSKRTHDALEYLERFKIGCLSYALVTIGGLDLHDVDYIETGETLENGTKIKEPKHLAMRKLLLRWTQDIRTRMFVKYNELLLKVALEAEKAISYDPVDLDTEIERLENRLEELKQEKNRVNNPDGTATIREQVKEIAELSASDDRDRRKVVKSTMDNRLGIKPQPLEEAIIPENANLSPALGPVRGTATPPPERPAQQHVAPPELETAPEPEVPSEAPQKPKESKLEWPEDSFVDPSDSDGMMAAVAAENARLLAVRRGEMPPAPSALNRMRDAQPPPARPPHASAREVSESLESEETRVLNASRKAMAESVGTLDGAKVFRQPVETLDRVDPAQAPQSKATLNAAKQSTNPRFTKVKQGP